MFVTNCIFGMCMLDFENDEISQDNNIYISFIESLVIYWFRVQHRHAHSIFEAFCASMIEKILDLNIFF